MTTGTNFLLKLLLVITTTGIGTGMSAIAVVLLAVDRGMSPTQIGLISGLQGVGLLVMTIPVGVMVDHFGPKRLYVLGGLMGALAFPVIPFLGSPWLLVLGTMALGVCIAFRAISLTSVFFGQLNAAGGARSGWSKGAHSIGMIFIGPFAGASAVKAIGFHATFMAIGALSLVAVLLALRILPDDKQETAVDGRPGELLERVKGVKAFFKEREIVEASMLDGLANLTNAFFNTFIVVIAIRNFHLDPNAAAALITTQGAVFVVSVFLLDHFSRRVGQTTAYLSGYGVIIAALSLLGGLASPSTLWVGAVLLGMGLAMTNILNVARIAGSGAKKGGVAGVSFIFNTLGSILGPAVGGFIGGFVGIQAVFWVLMPVFLLALLRIVSSPKEVAYENA